MARLAPVIFGLALLVLWIWAVLDVIATDRVLARNLHKFVWLLLVIFIPVVGAMAWLALGRPANAGFSPGATALPPDRRPDKPAPRGLEDSELWGATNKSTAPGPPDGFETTAAKERRLRAQEAEASRGEQPDDQPEGDPPT